MKAAKPCSNMLIALFFVCMSYYTVAFRVHPSLSSSTRPTRGLRLAMTGASKLFENIDILLFDCDGVLAETERDGHRVTFNKAFEAKGLSNRWSVDEYGELLKTGGGKERMTKYFDQVGWPDFVPVNERASFVKELHKLKTNLFTVIVENGEVPLRPNVDKLIDEAFANGIQVGVCSTSNEVAVTAIVRKNLGEERLKKMTIFAGDIVEKKKPAPDIYLLAAKTYNVDPKRCWVVEDSEIGMRAAKAAGMNCIVTKSYYTQHENFDPADVVVPDLSRGLDGPITLTYLNYKSSKAAYKPVSPTANAELFASDKQNAVEMFNKIAKGELGKGGMPF